MHDLKDGFITSQKSCLCFVQASLCFKGNIRGKFACVIRSKAAVENGRLGEDLTEGFVIRLHILVIVFVEPRVCSPQLSAV